MDDFKYITQASKGGRFVKAKLAAESMVEAEKTLLARQIPVLSIERVIPKGTKKIKSVNIKLKQSLLFSNQMKSAMSINLGLLRSIKLCRDQAVQKSFVPVLNQIHNEVEQGQSLYDSMRLTGSFDPLVLGLVRAGEGTGSLDEAFRMIAYMFKRESTIQRKIKKVMALPAITIVIAAVCVFFLMWKTIPQFVGLFNGMGVELPLPTKILIAVSNFTASYPWAVVLGIVGLIVFFLKLSKIYRALPSIHGALLKVPILGSFQKKVIQETFIRTFLSMEKTGDVPLLTALGLCRGVSPCAPFKGAVARAMVSVSVGSPLSKSLVSEQDIFGYLLVKSLEFGEETGETTQIITPLAEELGEEVMDFVDNLSTILEPVMTVFIASIVLVIMLALFIPIFSLPNLI